MNVPEYTQTKSDRDFMRAKDFFNFLRRMTYSVVDPVILDRGARRGREETGGGGLLDPTLDDDDDDADNPIHTWRRVDDL